VITSVAIQPVGTVYVTVAVPPDTPVSTPLVPSIVAVPAGVALQLPPSVSSVKVIVRPAHTADGPLTGPGKGFTVTE